MKTWTWVVLGGAVLLMGGCCVAGIVGITYVGRNADELIVRSHVAQRADDPGGVTVTVDEKHTITYNGRPATAVVASVRQKNLIGAMVLNHRIFIVQDGKVKESADCIDQLSLKSQLKRMLAQPVDD